MELLVSVSKAKNCAAASFSFRRGHLNRTLEVRLDHLHHADHAAASTAQALVGAVEARVWHVVGDTLGLGSLLHEDGRFGRRLIEFVQEVDRLLDSGLAFLSL